MEENQGAEMRDTGSFDYSFVPSPARVAVYDDLLSSPKILDIQPNTTREFINELAVTIHGEARAEGGEIPYSIILQVAENFIHSQFTEVVVSVLDGGNTIRFSDQGPGIPDKEKAQQPGYSSANAQMKHIINGVGSGLPIVREYMETKRGVIQIEDNIGTGAVVTISLNKQGSPELEEDDVASVPALNRARRTTREKVSRSSVISAGLSKRALSILSLFSIEDVWGVQDIHEELGIPLSSTHAELKKLEEAGMIAKLGKKRIITELGGKLIENLD